MEDKIYLEKYDGQSVDELIALEATHRIDSIVLAFESALCQKREQHGDSSINEIEWAILAVESLEREVNNGGFDQFFTNPSYEFVSYIISILNKISCPNTAAITQKAIDALGLEKFDFDSINERINEEDENLKKVLNTCDNEFYKYPDDIESRLFSFIKNNKENIVF